MGFYRHIGIDRVEFMFKKHVKRWVQFVDTVICVTNTTDYTEPSASDFAPKWFSHFWMTARMLPKQAHPGRLRRPGTGGFAARGGGHIKQHTNLHIIVKLGFGLILAISMWKRCFGHLKGCKIWHVNYETTIHWNCQGDNSGIHWRHWRQASVSPVNTRSVNLMTVPFLRIGILNCIVILSTGDSGFEHFTCRCHNQSGTKPITKFGVFCDIYNALKNMLDMSLIIM